MFGRPSTISDPRSEDLNQTDRNFTVDTSAEAKMMMGPATVRDRTKEFAAAAERAAKSLGASVAGGEGAAPSLGAQAGIDAGASSSAGTTSEFARMSARVGRGIHSTSQKLERLAQLAKSAGTFDDPSRDIAELSAVIKQDITALNSALAELQTHASHTQETKQGQDHSVTVVDTLKSRLMGATKSFKEVLTQRQEVVKEQNERRARYGGAGVGANRPNAFRRADFGKGSGGAFPRATHQADGGAGPGDASSAVARFQPPGSRGSLQGGGMLPTHHGQGGGGGFATGDQTQGQLLVQGQDQYLSARSEALQNVERTITELGGIFQQLATMVSEQGELAVRIDENVNESVANVDNAQTQLLKYMNSISSNRWLIMKIFGVLISFLVFFVVFVA